LRKFLYKILLSANILFAFTLVLSYLSVHINPADFALPAFFGLAYPYLLLINILFVIAWAALLKFEALISVLVIAAGFTHLSNYIRFGKQDGDRSGTFKIMSYNVRLFNYFETPAANSETRIISFLRDQKPDIICLQEFYVNGVPSQKEAAIKSALDTKYYSHMKVIGSGKNRYYGIVTLSKFPIISKGEIIHPKSSSLSIFSDIVIENDTFRLFNNHLQSFRLKRMERSFIEDLTATDDKETMNEVKKISVSLKKGFVQRAIQANVVKEKISDSPYPVIIAGDFNDTPVSYSYRRIRKGLKDSFVNSGYGAGFTYKGNYPANRIDYILYDDSLESARFDIIKVRFSDHYPVAAYFRKKTKNIK
jgi:endonuclease/exonuclease/phosphatase family metal-dependent hydrolase